MNSVTSTSFMPSISFYDNYYTATLPWKDDGAEIPNHLMLREGSLKGLLHRLQLTPDLLLEYDNIIIIIIIIIKDQLECGVIESVKPNQLNVTQQNVHYLPYHGVIRQASHTTKLYIVYNGSACIFE